LYAAISIGLYAGGVQRVKKTVITMNSNDEEKRVGGFIVIILVL